MTRYLLRRLAFFLPTLLVITLVAFALSKMAPGDPVELITRGQGGDMMGDLRDAERTYRETARQLGLDKPTFYFALSPLAYPDTLYRILNPDHRRTLRRLIARHGNWPAIAAYYQSLRDMDSAVRLAARGEHRTTILRQVQELYLADQEDAIRTQLLQINTNLTGFPEASGDLLAKGARLDQAFREVENTATRWRLFVPAWKWYGFDNQYHRWLSGCLRGDFGLSYRDGRPASTKIAEALEWTLILNLLSLFLAYGISIPLGVYTAAHRGSWFDRVTQFVLFLLYALPGFWVATLLLVLFTNPELGLRFFSVSGAGEYPPDATWGVKIGMAARQLVLPVFCLTYGSLAFITQQMRNAMLEVLEQDFIRTARAKGLPERQVIWKHALRNALFPIITLFGAVFPAMMAGSVVIESIFNLPGMGKLAVESIRNQDWPVVYAILLLSATLTMAGLLIADWLYAIADPRVTYRRKTSTA